MKPFRFYSKVILEPVVFTSRGALRVNKPQQFVKSMMTGAEGIFPANKDNGFEIMIGGSDEKTHRDNLFEALRRIESYGGKLVLENCLFGRTVVLPRVRSVEVQARPTQARSEAEAAQARSLAEAARVQEAAQARSETARVLADVATAQAREKAAQARSEAEAARALEAAQARSDAAAAQARSEAEAAQARSDAEAARVQACTDEAAAQAREEAAQAQARSVAAQAQVKAEGKFARIVSEVHNAPRQSSDGHSTVGLGAGEAAANLEAKPKLTMDGVVLIAPRLGSLKLEKSTSTSSEQVSGIVSGHSRSRQVGQAKKTTQQRDCPFKTKLCNDCKQMGHRTGHCKGAEVAKRKFTMSMELRRARNRSYSVGLDDEAKKTKVINIHRVFCQANRLQPGVKTAPRMLQGTHIDNYGFENSFDKCSVRQKPVKVRSNEKGIRPDPGRLKVLPAVLGAVTLYEKALEKLKGLRGRKGGEEGIPVLSARRLQRCALVLLVYDGSIKWINTKGFDKADSASRLIATHEKLTNRGSCHRNRAANQSHANRPVTFEENQTATEDDCTLTKVKELRRDGWAKTQKALKKEVAEVFISRDSFHVTQGGLVHDERIIIPQRYRSNTLKQLHEGHRMKMLARTKVYWPHIDEDIERKVQGCTSCAINAKSPIKCELQSWPVPKHPWSRLHIDFAGPVNGFYYLVLIDALTNWPEVYKMLTTTSTKTIECLEDAFSRHGLCDTIVSDNGPQLTSGELTTYCKTKGIQHMRTAPYHPQSNGRAERFVDILKTGLKKMEGEGSIDQVLRKFLFTYRNTPSHALGNKSPFQLMTGRTMKTVIDLLKPGEPQTSARNGELERQSNRQHGTKPETCKIGDLVFFQLHSYNKWKWSPGTSIGRKGLVNNKVLANFTSRDSETMLHVNQLKRSFNYIEIERNVFDDPEFTFTQSPRMELEPEIVPIVPQPRGEEDEDNKGFEDALEEMPAEDELPAAPEVPEMPRRSGRATAGTRPQRFDDFVMN